MPILNEIGMTDVVVAMGETVETSGHSLRTIVKHPVEGTRMSLQDLELTEARQHLPAFPLPSLHHPPCPRPPCHTLIQNP